MLERKDHVLLVGRRGERSVGARQRAGRPDRIADLRLLAALVRLFVRRADAPERTRLEPEVRDGNANASVGGFGYGSWRGGAGVREFLLVAAQTEGEATSDHDGGF